MDIHHNTTRQLVDVYAHYDPPRSPSTQLRRYEHSTKFLYVLNPSDKQLTYSYLAVFRNYTKHECC